MTIRIQPKEITIPDESGADPFANDSLGRKESIEILTHLVQSVEGPCTIAVDAPWGTGKTTFLKVQDTLPTLIARDRFIIMFSIVSLKHRRILVRQV